MLIGQIVFHNNTRKSDSSDYKIGKTIIFQLFLDSKNN